MRRDEVAGPVINEVAVDRASHSNALKGANDGASHEPCSSRPRLEEEPDLRPLAGRPVVAGSENRDEGAEGTVRRAGAEPGRARDLLGGLQGRRLCELGG